MEVFTTFLANNYFWFLIIALVLIFALIGYFVDASEQKKGISSIVKEKTVDKDINDLAKLAGNKSLNSAIYNQDMPQLREENSNNTITTLEPNNSNQNANPVGFEVLKK